jgi:arylsulfatase A-like enzyme
MANFNGMAAIETPEFMMSKLDEFGGEGSYGHYAVGWAWAMNAPYQWTKQVAWHWGGTRNGMIVHRPKGIKEKGGQRSQFCHVIDVAPTVLEAAGIPEPTMVNGVMQCPYEGTSMLYAFNDAKAPERHETQYFEMFCNRGIYHKGWSAVTKQDSGLHLLGRRDHRHRLRVGDHGQPRLHRAHEQVQRQDPVGADRSGRRRQGCRSLHRP